MHGFSKADGNVCSGSFFLEDFSFSHNNTITMPSDTIQPNQLISAKNTGCQGCSRTQFRLGEPPDRIILHNSFQDHSGLCASFLHEMLEIGMCWIMKSKLCFLLVSIVLNVIEGFMLLEKPQQTKNTFKFATPFTCRKIEFPSYFCGFRLEFLLILDLFRWNSSANVEF